MATRLSRIADYLLTSNIPVLMLDADGVPAEWNNAAVRLFPELGQNRTPSAKKTILEHIAGLLRPEERSLQRKDFPATDESFVADFPLAANDGGTTWLRLIAQRQEREGFFCIIENITTAKKRELRLTEAKEQAEKDNVSRGQFLANMSHEIRTPIQTIIGMMELLTETKLDEEQTEYARQVRFSADVMLTLINDILDISKIEAGKMRIEEIEYDLTDVIERTVDLVSMEAHKKGLEIGIDISPELPATVIGDPIRFRQILLNLVKNSVKFTERGHIIVRAEPIVPGDTERLHVEVIDTGIGVNPEIQDKLFNQFVQADSSTTRKYGGTGLGLAISKSIVTLMRGKIGIRSNRPSGAIFWFDIPLVAAPEQPANGIRTPQPLTRFLIVDDNAVASDILTRMIGVKGYSDITRAESGMDALERLRTATRDGKPFDIVFIDMVMPEMDGWRLAAEINRNREINQAKLYMMVPEGSFGADAKMKLLEWFNGYLYKPVKRHLLYELLDAQLQEKIDLEVVDELESAEPETKDHGATAEPDATTTPGQEAATDQPERGLTILVAEDHPVNRKLLRIFLEKNGARVVTAEDGQEATECVQKEKIDLIFMDVQMPRMNGYEATRWIRDHGYTIPVIACTANAGENDHEQCLSYGMTDVLPKPYKRQEVTDIIRKNLSTIILERAKRNDAETGQSDETATAGIFDGEAFRDLLMGDIDGAQTLAREFLEQTTAHIGVLGEDISSGNTTAIREATHLIKGSSLNMTANELAGIALKMEKTAETASGAELADEFERLKEAFARLREELKKEGLVR
jgi:signal transduction histidine kinase/CheY-like chemotaxis protein